MLLHACLFFTICMCQYEKTDVDAEEFFIAVVQLPCGFHTYHRMCIDRDQWFSKNALKKIDIILIKKCVYFIVQNYIIYTYNFVLSLNIIRYIIC